MNGTESRIPISGMNTREQVCIALRVPESGTAWLDELIRKARYIEFHAVQYAGVSQNPQPDTHSVFNAKAEADEAMGNPVA